MFADADAEDHHLVALLAGRGPKGASGRERPHSAALTRRLLADWQVLPSLSDDVADDLLLAVLTPEDHARLRNARLGVAAFQRAQVAGSAGLLEAFDVHGVPYSLLKGAAAACLLYPERHMRGAWDIDIGVAWDDIGTAEALALSSGYHQAQRDPDRPFFRRADRELRAIVEESHFELGFLVRRLEVTNLSDAVRAALRDEPWLHQFWHDAGSVSPWCYSVVDIHHKVSLDIELRGLLAATQRVVRAEASLSVPDLAWFGAHLIFKLYWESVHKYGKGLYQFADVVRLAPLLDDRIFARLVVILENHKLLAAGYHVLKHVPDFGVALPPHVANFIADMRSPPLDTDPIETNDLGDMWPKLWGRR